MKTFVKVYDLTEKEMLDLAAKAKAAGISVEAKSLQTYAQLKFHDALADPKKFMMAHYWVEEDDCAYITANMNPKQCDRVIKFLTNRRNKALEKDPTQSAQLDIQLMAVVVWKLKREKAKEIVEEAVRRGDLVRDGDTVVFARKKAG
jgi:hypothetical protein